MRVIGRDVRGQARVIAVALSLALSAACSAPEQQPRETPAGPVAGEYLQAALQAANWLRSTAIQSDDGMSWPADPYDTATVVADLYTGTPGVVLFFLELYRHTGDESYLDDASAGADFLLARLGGGAGLYTGVAGMGFVLHEAYKVTGHERHRAGALLAVQMIHDQARESGDGVDWIDSTDIVSGAAGTGLFLLYAVREMGSTESLALAALAGRRLLEQAEEGAGGLRWRINAEYPRVMPNFSHGTAGVAYFLAALNEATGDPAFLDAAVSGATQLLELAETEGDVCLIFHHSPDGEELQYLSWCHGPAGTARTFHKLFQVTGDPVWSEWTDKSANGIHQSGIPEQLTDGFWNNVGQCCGSAGVAEFSLAMHRTTGDPRHLEFARQVADNLLGRATDDAGGLMWVQAENRTQPEFLVAQTGYMQGAAGIGILLLHLDAAINGTNYTGIVFPDAPY